MNAPLFSAEGEARGETSLPTLFEGPVNEALLHQAVVTYLANQRQGTSDTKTRAEVRGGGRKPWRQKGTGRARQGTIRAPHWRKGGVVFGPHPRDFRMEFPKRARRAALRSALAQKAKDGSIVVLEGLTFEEPKTSRMLSLLEKIGAQRPLVVTGELDKNAVLSVRNLPRSEASVASDLNAYAVLRCTTLVLTQDAMKKLEEAFS